MMTGISRIYWSPDFLTNKINQGCLGGNIRLHGT